MKARCLLMSLVLGIGTALALFNLLSRTRSPVAAAPTAGTRYVAIAGDDFGNDCASPSAPCRTIQHAVDVADPDDTIKVAAGAYTDIHARDGVTQVVYISKTVVLQGGYALGHWDVSKPEVNPTTLDAQGQGRALYVTGVSGCIVEGLRITGGDASGLCGGRCGAGGGIYVGYAEVVIRNNWVCRNVGPWHGGGVYVSRSSATISGNTVVSNTASNGGGLYITRSGATLTNNVVADNKSDTRGAGLFVAGSKATLSHTTIAHNGGAAGSGIFLCSGSTIGFQCIECHVVLTNTILVKHTVAISVARGGTVEDPFCSNHAALQGTLWHGNGIDTGGAGTILTGTVNLYDDPAFLNPDSWDYHLGVGSAGIDAGIDSGVTTDMDGHSRPHGAGYDIGADEFVQQTIYLPLTLRRWPPIPEVPALYAINNTDGDGNYTVRWSAADRAASYVLQEAAKATTLTDGDFTTVYSGWSRSHSVSRQGAGRYHYRVKAVNNWGDSAWSKMERVDVLREAEPNGYEKDVGGANGPLVSGRTYRGYPDDQDDYFYFELSSHTTVNVVVDQFAPTSSNGTVSLYGPASGNGRGELIDYYGEPGDTSMSLGPHTLRPGKYYIRVYTAGNHSETQAYRLKVTY